MLGIVDKSHKSDLVLEYYVVCSLSFLTFKKIKKLEQLKTRLRKMKEERSKKTL